MGELLDTGLRALIAPHEGGGGAGLALGALAAATGLAVLGITAREKAQQALANVPVARVSIQDCLHGRALGWLPLDQLRELWNQPLDFSPVEGGVARPRLKDFAAKVGWTEPPKDEEDRAVLIDALLEAGHPVGIAAQAFATDTPFLRVAPDGVKASIYNYDQLPELMALTPRHRVDLVGERAQCHPIAFSVARAFRAHRSRYVQGSSVAELSVLGALATARDQADSYWTWITDEEDE